MSKTTKKQPAKETTKQATRSEKIAQREMDRERLAKAVAEIVRNPETPDELFDYVSDFLVQASSGELKDYWSNPAIVAHTLQFHRKQGAP